MRNENEKSFAGELDIDPKIRSLKNDYSSRATNLLFTLNLILIAQVFKILNPYQVYSESIVHSAYPYKIGVQTNIGIKI